VYSSLLAAPMLVVDAVRTLPSNCVTAIVQIWANKARSLLTVLGIIIAVTSIITVVSVVQGFGNFVTDFLKGFGTNAMWVYPHRPPGVEGERMGRITLDMHDVRAVERDCEKVLRASPLVWTRATIEYGGEVTEGFELRGASEVYQGIRNLWVDKGRFFGAVDVENATHVAVAGRNLLEKLRCDDSVIGDYIRIDNQRFQVVGLLEEKGSFLGESLDAMLVIPYTAALKMYPSRRDQLVIMSQATDEESVDEAVAQITRVLRRRHGLKAGQPNDFGVETQDQFLSFFERVKLIATSVLSGIVGISLLVGGIGIMNVMLVSVTERTREIGLRKSVGARRRDILLQFLTEAVVLATCGGAIGVALGYGIGYIASLHPKMVDVIVPIWAVALALGFSAAVGIIFGIIPAFKAAILHPIDALRHE
jgi:putative ABC transport system permease protein